MANSIIELYTQVPADLEGNVFGQFDEHLKLIERTLNVTLISRDGMLKILGTEQSATQAKKLIEELVGLAGKGNTITRQNVSYGLSLAMEERNQVLTEIDKDLSAIRYRDVLLSRDFRTKGLCRADPQKNDRLWYRTGGNR
mgnify:CR=1 FL=1